MNYHLITLGCQMNKSDSERVATVIENMGYRWTDMEDEADLLGIIACSVRQKAIDKVYTRIHKWNSWKNNRNILTFVTGCLLPADREKFLKLFDFIFQISELVDFPVMIRQYGVVTPIALASNNGSASHTQSNQPDDKHFQTLIFDGEKKSIAGLPLVMKKPETKITGFWNIGPHYRSLFEAFIPIQNGCDKFCTFCAVPYTRGREISRPSEKILAEIKSLVEKGYKSITLLGQNVNSYGLDKKVDEISFPQLLQAIGEYGKLSGNDFWVYFTSPHPRDMNDEVLRIMSEYKCLAKQVHLPLQSGDDKVLIRMNRSHSYNDYLNIIRSVREYLPTATLFTDIIVGFTGETEEQFMNTFRAMDEIRFNMAYIARYSPRPGAASARWDDDISHTIKKERLHKLGELLQKHSLEHNRSMVCKTFKILVTGADHKKNYLSGLTEGKIIVRFESESLDLIGRFVEVRINSAAEFATEGKLINVYDNRLAHV
jgi:tRNA-2-methylthio-N6-dimethylallyladenosine synthase